LIEQSKAMSGDWLRVMIERGRSSVTSVSKRAGASPRSQPSSKSSRRRGSNRPETFDAAPRPRRRYIGASRSA
jgi:hypothetical protein